MRLFRGEIKTLILKNGLDCWQIQWDESSKGRRIYSTRKSAREIVSYTGNSREGVMSCRMRLGHVGLYSSSHFIGKHGTGMCNGCMVAETVEHVLLYCETYYVERERLFDRVREVGRNGEWVVFCVWVMGVVRLVVRLHLIRNAGLV